MTPENAAVIFQRAVSKKTKIDQQLLQDGHRIAPNSKTL
jgi:hypothetical protein